MKAFLLAALLAGGEKVADFSLADTQGKTHALHAQKEARAVVLFFTGTECPLANRYLPRLAELHRAFCGRGVVFWAVNSSALETAESIANHARDSAIPFPVLLDRDQKVADALAIRLTPTIVVIDSSWAVRYRGALDDNKHNSLVKRRYLFDALTALLEGRNPEPAETATDGCQIQRPLAESRDGSVTYARDIAPLLNRSCVPCHRPDQVAPFPLLTYGDARRWARDIKRTTQLGLMPPWKPVDGGPFLHERRLSKDELALLARWADAGAPPGDLSKAPPAPKFAEGWMLGTPDLILEAPEYEFTAEGDDEWRCFVLPKEFTDETWVSAIELRPGNPKAVHHIVVWLDRTGRSLKLDDADPRPGWKTDGTGPGFAASGEMGGWAPGNLPYRLPEGVARELKRGTRIVLDIHYHKGGRAGRDKTVLGLHFAKAPVKQALLGRHLINHNFRIPPGAERHKVVAFQTMTEDSHTLSLMPHMHYLGRELKVEALFPDDTRRTLVHITDWDFNGQDTYLLREPVALPRGTKVRLEAIYDNSEKNPNNPNRPPIAVRWGERTTDEMCVAFLWYTKDAEDRTKTEAAPRD